MSDTSRGVKCVRCGSDTRMQVQALISAPSWMEGEFSKTNIRRKDVHLIGVNWEAADFICTNHKCRYVLSRFGNYVTNLKKENEQLKQQLGLLSNDNDTSG